MKRLALRIRAVITGVTLASVMVTQVIPFRAFAEEISSPQSDVIQNVTATPVSDTVTTAPTDGSFLLPVTLVVETVAVPVVVVPESGVLITAPAVETVTTPTVTISEPATPSVPAVSEPVAVSVTSEPVTTPVVVASELVVPVVSEPVITSQLSSETIVEPAYATVIATPSTDDSTAMNTDEATDEVTDDEIDAIDLGDDQAELDAQKDFTGVVRQSKPYTCGPASLATLRTQLGDDTSEQDVLRYVTEISEEKGVSLLTLKNAGQMLGSQVFLKHWSADQILSYIKETQDPVLIHDEKEGVGGHFSVIREYDAEKGIIELSDTEAGNIKYAIKDFEHIYTGDAFIISEGEAKGILADTSTDLSDDIAATIWGKYVPVSVIAAKSGNDAVKNAAAVFAGCTRDALALSTAIQRNAQRKVCYVNLANTIGDSLNNSGETNFVTEYNTKYYADDLAAVFGKKAAQTKDQEGQLGTDSILNILKSKLSVNKKILEDYQSQLTQKQNQLSQSDSGQYAKKQSLLTQINAKNGALINPQTQKALGDSALKPKVDTANKLQNEISSGSFTQNGQTFALGAVGNQVVAQSATYARLSSNLSSRLSSLSGQVAQAERSLSNAQSNYKYYNDRASMYQGQADSSYGSYKYYSKMGWRYAFSASKHWGSYVYSNGLAYRARLNASYQNNQVSNYRAQITALNNQKNSAQTEVANASAEAARLQRLKAFGEQEVQRKKAVLNTLQNDITSIRTQLEKINAKITQLKVDLSSFQLQYDAVTNAQPPLTTAQINQLNSDIASLKVKISSLSTEIASEKVEIDGEANFERIMSNKTEVVATDDMRGALASALKKTEKTVTVVLGVGVIVVGGVAICVGTVAGCGPVIAAAGSFLGSTPVLVVTGAAITASTVNDASIVLTQKDVFGKEYTDEQWTSATSSLMTNATLVVGAGATKVVSTSIRSLLTELPVTTGVVGKALGLSTSEIEIALSNESRIQHALRHLGPEDANILPNWNNANKSVIYEFYRNALANPYKTFEHTLVGGTKTTGYLVKFDGKDVVVFVYKEGADIGKIASSWVPSGEQLASYLLK